ncbi:hypothetical protein C491_06733 [Natronococcus amylolyticus DSM 10524]|uniref:Uncharacterized protein n=1 Tax=Natronococcus amylolyticus DSM 10524 TaxID=1227497 RepID=L9XCN3_9EURY|nr:hypothetical protein [Natronococcus amylolyticus]ELY59485.1 hypothetical protein C491_06733 [Natronococcus amylolyticus DSM 10524]
MGVPDVGARLRANPVAATIELASVCIAALLLVGTVSLLLGGLPIVAEWPWLLIIGVGAAFVLFWTVLVPTYERTLQ